MVHGIMNLSLMRSFISSRVQSLVPQDSHFMNKHLIDFSMSFMYFRSARSGLLYIS